MKRSYHLADSRAVALWLPPERPPLDADTDARLAEAVETLGPDVVNRWVALTEVMEERHPPRSHHYLWFLAVHPSAQGQGLGGALLRDRLAWCDQHCQPAYLEATSPRNRGLYERHGFEGDRRADGLRFTPPVGDAAQSAPNQQNTKERKDP